MIRSGQVHQVLRVGGALDQARARREGGRDEVDDQVCVFNFYPFGKTRR